MSKEKESCSLHTCVLLSAHSLLQHKMNYQQEHKDSKLRKGLWSPEEDEQLSKHILQQGHSRWSAVPKLAGLQRSGKSCRLRWINYLRPELKREKFSLEEERLLIELHKLVGNRWAYIATHLPGRTDNDVKNYWNSRIRKKVGEVGMRSAKKLAALQPIVTDLNQNSCSSQNIEQCDFNLEGSNCYHTSELYGQHLSMLPIHSQQMQMVSEDKLELLFPGSGIAEEELHILPAGPCNSNSSNGSTSLTLDSSTSSGSDCGICGGQCCLEELPVLHHVRLDGDTPADQGPNQPIWDLHLP